MLKAKSNIYVSQLSKMNQEVAAYFQKAVALQKEQHRVSLSVESPSKCLWNIDQFIEIYVLHVKSIPSV